MILRAINKFDRILHNLIKLKYFRSKNNIIFEYNAISKNTSFEGNNKISEGCKLLNCEIGRFSYFNSDTVLFNTRIGRYSSIGSRVKNIRGMHPTDKFVSTHPIFYSLKEQVGRTFVSKQKFEESIYLDEKRGYCNYIGNDVWIGSDVRIIEGVSIGDGAVVAAGSVVIKNVPAYTIVGGVPAKEIRKRFSHDQIEFLMNIKWWTKSEQWILEHADFFEDIEIFIEKVKHEQNC